MNGRTDRKIALVGGGSVRSPLVVFGVNDAAQALGASEMVLYDPVPARLQVMVDSAGSTVAEGRSKGDAPEIDGKVFFHSRRPVRPGDIVTVKVERADAYDLHGTVV